MSGLPHGHLTVELKGYAGQSLGAFSVQGLRIELTGEANDYVGKACRAPPIVIKPAPHLQSPHINAIIGNTVLYGATAGLAVRRRTGGRALRGEELRRRDGDRGCGANGCEYMTGGTAVILGSVGDNFAAGMTGGMAYVLDLDGRFETAGEPRERGGPAPGLDPLGGGAAGPDRRARHRDRLGFAADLLRDWDIARGQFWQVCPKEMVARLKHPLSVMEAEASA